ncbi:hypothetical protein Sa4125_25130 [Aureimonas sp. SA4125]|uniref:hypothetical protein n=1 Tax=Aureimonas sp. SA4125 TaxID=2826993 RepID=UPI001CC5D348|nr:hypothetical protein [Aureimonas sp. SA4125]BDA84971.1 hypothetical protein Sa4125_25130 [Aureimonas sp. SA4125]
MTDRYRLARKGDRIPMPERGPGVFFSGETEGEALDSLNPYHARLIADGSVKLIKPDPDPEAEAGKHAVSSPTAEGPKSAASAATPKSEGGR